jgi:molecular chaperone HtpG
MEALAKEQSAESLSPELIGQFGVGFYSAFHRGRQGHPGHPGGRRRKPASVGVQRRRGLHHRGAEKARARHHHHPDLKKREKDEKDFTDEWTLRSIVKQHSDFVGYPIVMDVERDEPIPESEQIKDKDGKPVGETTRKVIKEETLNSMKAIWARNKDEVTDEEYEEFYKHISHDWNPPLTHLHMKFEGTTEYTRCSTSLQGPFRPVSARAKARVQLYCKRVFIMDDCKELMPEYFRFVKGVVDAPDLNLNVSREILQQDRLVRTSERTWSKNFSICWPTWRRRIRNNFYEEFGPILKIGIHTDPKTRKKIADLARYKTTRPRQWVSLRTYVENMQPDQKDIYYITGDNLAALLNSPHLEKLKEKDFEVLLMTDPVDEWVVQSLTEYDGKPLKSAEKGDLGLEDEVDNAKKGRVQRPLRVHQIPTGGQGQGGQTVRPPEGLVACLSGDAHDMSAYMEKILKASGQKLPEVKRVLELNMDHPVGGSSATVGMGVFVHDPNEKGSIRSTAAIPVAAAGYRPDAIPDTSTEYRPAPPSVPSPHSPPARGASCPPWPPA